MQGILEGKNVQKRMSNRNNWVRVKSGESDKLLNAFWARANDAVRQVFYGKVTYASLIWEASDWNLFDFVGVDHYFAYGKPVVITEFGFRTYQGAASTPERLGGDIVDHKTEFIHHIPLLRRFFRPTIRP